MKGFIEVTDKDDNSKMLIAVGKIARIYETPWTIIVTGTFFIKSKKPITEYFNIAETYDEVVAKIIAATE